MRIMTALAMLAVAAGAARADEVVLRNGARFEGRVEEGKDSVTVVMDFGTMTFKRIDVARIDRGPSALSEFDAKVVELKADDLDGRCKLALWARRHQLDQRATKLLEDILARDPEHAGAREALGYRRHEGRWMTGDEVKTAQGLVLFRGEWLKREMADEIRRIEAEKEAELARIRTIESFRIRAAEAEAAAYRAQEDAARARAQADDDDFYSRRSYVIFRNFGFPCRPRPALHLGNVCAPAVKCPPKGDPKCK